MNAFQLLKCGTSFKKDNRNQKVQKLFKPVTQNEEPIVQPSSDQKDNDEELINSIDVEI